MMQKIIPLPIDDAQPEEESDPSVARDLAWLTELRRSHPGFFW